MTKIVALSGRKSSGKNTLSNYLHGHEMKRHDVIEQFQLGEQGELVVNCTFVDNNGKEFEEMGVLDLNQNNDEFFQYAAHRIWPLIRQYSFADSLKEMCVMLFNIPPECVYGTDDQKNRIQEHLLWENMPGVLIVEENEYDEVFGSLQAYGYDEQLTIRTSGGAMTAREFMQFMGTEVMRKMYGPVWIENCLRRIETDQPPIAVITDCRFVNEVEAIHEVGGKVVRLTRKVFEDSHASEKDADGYEGFDAVIDNQEMNINQSAERFLEILVEFGYTQKLRQVGKSTASIR